MPFITSSTRKVEYQISTSMPLASFCPCKSMNSYGTSNIPSRRNAVC
jgi:hypothetical protein